MNSSIIRIAQVSDIHLFSTPNKNLLGVDTHESFNAVLDLMRKITPDLDLILLTGDLSQDGSILAYEQVADLISEFNVPVYCIPGNHDDSTNMKAFFPYKKCTMQKHVVLAGWQLILLDSHIQTKVPGLLEKNELDFMVDCLRTYPDHRALVIFHHHPVSIDSAWLDPLGVTNADDFWHAIAPFSQLHAIIFGHVHQVIEGVKNNVHYYSAPSTCIQFKRHSDPFALEKLPPGFRMIELFADGTLKTEVHRVVEYIGTFDENAKGY